MNKLEKRHSGKAPSELVGRMKNPPRDWDQAMWKEIFHRLIHASGDQHCLDSIRQSEEQLNEFTSKESGTKQQLRKIQVRGEICSNTH